MGTRSLTFILEKPHRDVTTTVACIYRQYDGYPEGHGMDLFEKFGDFQLCNGFGGGDNSKWANGMGCLGAQIVDHLKEGIGNIYLVPVTTQDMWEEFVYEIYPNKENKISMTVNVVHLEPKYELETIYRGLLSEYGDWIKTQIPDKEE